MAASSEPHKSTNWVWPALCLILGVALLFAAWQNLQLKREMAEIIERSPGKAHFANDRTGDPAPTVHAYMLDGQPFELRTDALQTPIALLWFSSGCEPCVLALENWNKLAIECPDRVWGITFDLGVEPDPAFLGEHVQFPILEPQSEDIFAQYDLNITPQTMIVRPGGTIGNVWYGPLNEQSLQEVIDVLSGVSAR